MNNKYAITIVFTVFFSLGLNNVDAFTTTSKPIGRPRQCFAPAKSTRHQATKLQLDLSSWNTILSPTSIHDAFSVATFFPQPFWLLLVFLPNSGITKKIMGGMEIVTLCCLVHFFIVSASIVQPEATAPLAEFSGVFDPAGDPQKAFIGMMQYPNFISEEWSHVLTWDIFVGRWIWLDGIKRGIFTSHSVLLCNFIGPPGLLLHWVTCLVSGKGIVENEVESIVEERVV